MTSLLARLATGFVSSVRLLSLDMHGAERRIIVLEELVR